MKEKLEISRELVCFPILATEKNFCSSNFAQKKKKKNRKKRDKNDVKEFSE